MSTTTVHPPGSDQAASRPLNPKMILPFVRSTQNVLATMVRIEATIGKPFIKADPVASYDVSGIIGFSGSMLGSVIITMQMAVAQKLVASFTGMDIPTDSPDFVDAIGELANMIAGSAKKDLEAGANISVPTVIVGAGHVIARLSGVPCIVIPCHTPAGDFAIEVNIKPQ